MKLLTKENDSLCKIRIISYSHQQFFHEQKCVLKVANSVAYLNMVFKTYYLPAFSRVNRLFLPSSNLIRMSRSVSIDRQLDLLLLEAKISNG